jgi:hypothetical protein
MIYGIHRLFSDAHRLGDGRQTVNYPRATSGRGLAAAAQDERLWRTALCAEAARAAVPSAWTIVEEIAEKSPYPTLTKARMAILMY